MGYMCLCPFICTNALYVSPSVRTHCVYLSVLVNVLCCQETPFPRLLFSFRSLVHFHYGKKHAGIQTDVVLKKELRVLYLDPNAARRGRHRCLDFFFGRFKAYPFLQTSPNKDMPTPTRPHLFVFPFEVVHSQMIKHSNIWAYEGNSYSHHTTIYSQLQATVYPHIFTTSDK